MINIKGQVKIGGLEDCISASTNATVDIEHFRTVVTSIAENYYTLSDSNTIRSFRDDIKSESVERMKEVHPSTLPVFVHH